jgi:hypothetical protein
MKIHLLAAAIIVATSVPASAAGRLADGRYTCNGWIGNMISNFGTVEVKGATYRGMNKALSGPFKPFTVTGNAISFASPFGSLESLGKIKTVTLTPGKTPAFTVNYTTARGYAEALDCTHD